MKKNLVAFGMPIVSAIVCFSSVQPAQAGSECGVAAYYDQESMTANGEPFNPKALTAAHPSLPFGTWITVVDQDTGKSVKVRINDRGPWMGGYILDMTPAVINAIDPQRTADTRRICIYW
jgi:rare lipoprotein A